MIHSEDGISVVPPQFINFLQSLSQRVLSHPGTVTGAPGKAYADPSFSPQLPECIQCNPSSAPLTVRQLSVKWVCIYLFPIIII